jgi:hypothetical protein
MSDFKRTFFLFPKSVHIAWFVVLQGKLAGLPSNPAVAAVAAFALFSRHFCHLEAKEKKPLLYRGRVEQRTN